MLVLLGTQAVQLVLVDIYIWSNTGSVLWQA
jgi:hypothetical protein